jgi:PadR family transcriptional regulator AphA
VARENKTKFALLGLLSWQPMSGYDIKKVYEFSLGNFWSESYGQIYPILRQLQDEGFVDKTTERDEGRPERHVYQITPAGSSALLEWLAQPSDPLKVKVEILLKVLHGFQAPPEVTIAEVRRFREENVATLKRYERTAEQLEARRGGPFDHAVPYWLLTLRCAQLTGEAFINWCDEALTVLAGLGSAEAVAAPESPMYPPPRFAPSQPIDPRRNSE